MKKSYEEKILRKHEDASKRHQERLEMVRNRAFESTVQRYSTDEAASSSSNPPILQPYLPRKKCEICNIIIHNEVQLQSHLRGRKHKDQLKTNEGRKLSGEEIQTCNLKYIVDAADNEQDPKILLSKERIKAMKKRFNFRTFLIFCPIFQFLSNFQFCPIFSFSIFPIFVIFLSNFQFSNFLISSNFQVKKDQNQDEFKSG